jgi:hypothetical protein
VRTGRSSTSSADLAVRVGATTGSVAPLLGVGAFGLAWSLTTTAAYLPLCSAVPGSTTLIALVLAAEASR